MQNFDRIAANIAADAEINDDLLTEGVRLPDDAITPASIGQPDGLLAEEYYAALESQARQSAPSQGALAQSEKDGDDSQAGESRQGGGKTTNQDAESAQGNGSSQADRGGGEENLPGPSPTAEGGSQADDAQPGDRGDASARAETPMIRNRRR